MEQIHPVRCLFVSLALLACAGAPLWAELGLETTQGPGDFRQDSVNLDVNASKKVNIGLGYIQSISADAAIAKTYSLSAGVKLGDRFSARGSLSNTPEANGGRSGGWGASGSYYGGSGQFDWGASMALNQTTMSEHWQSQTTVQRLRGKHQATTTITNSGWRNLTQNNLVPSLSVDLPGAASLSCGYGIYFYDRDVRDFSGELSRLTDPVRYFSRNARYSMVTDFGNLPFLVRGFPENIFFSGMAVFPFKQLRVACDWSRTTYVLEAPPVDSSVFSIAYTFCSAVRARLGYSILSTDEACMVAGLGLLW